MFAVTTDGMAFTNLHSFTIAYGGSSPPYYINSDGYRPLAGLVLSANTLYGIASFGGGTGYGTVFAVNTNGTGFKSLHYFLSATYTGVSHLQGGLILSGNVLYGTAYSDGSAGNGTVFAVNTDGTHFTNLHSFTATGIYPNPKSNSDGAYPQAGLILSGNTLYGTASAGGSAGSGTVFAINTDSTGFTTLHSFTATTSYYYTNSDGASPLGGLFLSGNTLYGTASAGGSAGNGTVFSISLPIAPPQLTILPGGSNIVLTWPANAVGYTLQSAPASTGTFTNVPGAISPYTIIPTDPQQFFRLISN